MNLTAILDALTQWIKDLGPRLRVILTAAVTWLLVAQAALVAFADQIGPLLPTPWADRINAFIISAVAVIVAVIAIIRRVTPVLPEERGILPPN